jgi:hypothetical protein
MDFGVEPEVRLRVLEENYIRIPEGQLLIDHEATANVVDF